MPPEPTLAPDAVPPEDWADAAYHGERVASRRLARHSGLSELAALLLTLERVAGPAGLAALLDNRRHLRAAQAQRLAEKSAARTVRMERREAARQPPAGAWSGWFDGSAQPNPGRIGIGALLTGPAGERVEISRRAGHGNSGEAEYAALIALLEVALTLRPAMLALYGDSRVVIDDVHLPDGPGAVGLGPQRSRVRTLLSQLPAVTLCWIPRQRNAAADRLAQLGGALAAPDDDAASQD